MPSAPPRTAVSVERFFQLSLVGLVSSAYLALASSGYLDRPTLILTAAGLLGRALIVSGVLRIRIPATVVTLAALGYVVFLPLDFYFISRDFLAATIHGVCFLATIKILTAQSSRDYIYIGVISFLELISAALLSASAGFFGYLGLYLVFAIAAFTSAEIWRGFERHTKTVAPLRAKLGWRLTIIAIASTGAILLITAGLFLIVPRTARMAAVLFPNTRRLTGFSNVVDLGGFGPISRDDRAVMHILPYSPALPKSLKWRGAALSRFDGRRWSEPTLPGRSIPTVRGYAEIADQLQRSRRDGSRFLYRVDIQNADTGILFIAGIPEFINVDAPRIVSTQNDSIRVLPPRSSTLRYEVSAHSGPPLPSPLSRMERARYLDLPPVDIRIYRLARQWAGAGSPLDRALAIEQHLQREFKYTLDGPRKPVRDPLSDFLFVRKEGYCEYFASAMAVMLRSLGIPARVATGFQSGYYNEVSGLYVVRASDAHAWVETWLDGRGWTSFDPTPAAGGSGESGMFSRINMYLDAVDNTWQEWVVSYDLSRQIAIAAKFDSMLRSWGHTRGNSHPDWKAGIVAHARRWGLWIFAAFVIVPAIVIFMPRLWSEWRQRSRVRRIARAGGSPSDASILYERMLHLLARRGFQKPPWFTPSEFARNLPAEESQRVLRFTTIYNSIRFGGDAAATSRLASLLQEFEAR